MKRLIPLLLAMLILSACGTPASEPTPTPSVDIAGSTPEDLVKITLPPYDAEVSAYARWVRPALKELRENEAMNDEDKVHGIVTMYIDLWYDRQYQYDCTDYSVFKAFFDENAEGYENLAYHSTEARYIALSDALSGAGPVVWNVHHIELTTVELDEDSAVINVRSPYREICLNYAGMPRGLNTYRISLGKVDGVWYLTDIEPNSIYGSDRHGTYDELLETIDELEAEYAAAQKAGQ